MALYEVVLRCYLPIPNAVPGLARFYEVGETVEFSGVPGRSLEPLDDAARAAKAARDAAVPYEILSNGLQARHRQTGELLNVKFRGV